MPNNITHIKFEGIDIPVKTPCKISKTVQPECQIVLQKGSCVRGPIEQGYCATCTEIVYQKIIR